MTAKAHNRLRGSMDNILTLPMTAQSIASGMTWYPAANKVAGAIGTLAGFSDYEATKVGAGVLSALSPTIEWGRNIEIAILLVTEGTRKTYGLQCDKAMQILEGMEPMDVLGDRAPKTKAFYQAIIDPNNDYSPPVIDRHAVAIYMGRAVSEKELRLLESTPVWNRVQNAYLRASKQVGMNHHILQAQTWCQWRTNKKLDGGSGRQLTIE